MNRAVLLILSLAIFAISSIYANFDQAKKAFYAKDYQKAYSAIQQDLKENSKNPDVLILAGDIYGAIGNHDSAIILYKAVERLQPTNYGIPRKIGQIHASKKDFKTALSMLTSVVKDFPKDPWNHLAFADVCMQSGKLNEAEKAYLESRKLNSRLWQASVGLATIAQKKSDMNAAVTYYEDALKIDPGMMDIRKLHVKLVKDNKDPDPSPDETISVNKPPYADNSLIMSKLQYPELAKKAGLEGKVVLRVLVRRNGNVKKFIVESTDSEIFNKSAGDAVMKTQFLPALQNGKPIACWLSVPISFKLR